MTNISALHELYSNDANGLFKTINNIYDRIELEGLNPIWISIIDREKSLNRVKELSMIKIEDRISYPLYGIPFAVKDNIDVIGLPTTAGCKTFSKQLPNESAPIVIKLEQAGGILIGKTNMDQFATGLVGTRSSYGICSSVFNKNFISGGSSSGSAVAVASQLVTFSLGTDTAGSGRIPSMFNNIIGLKPTRGLISTCGVLPACRSLDCVSIFAETIYDVSIVLSVIRGYDENDPYSRVESICSTPWIVASKIRFGIPTIETQEYFDDKINSKLFQNSINQIKENLNIDFIEFDFKPFIDVANLLYNGSWVAERYVSVGNFIDQNQQDIDPNVYSIINKSKNYRAIDLFQNFYQLELLKKKINFLWKNFDIILVPTAPRQYTIEEINSSPIQYNTNLGYYTNFVNLLDLSAISIPAGIRQDGLPFSITIIGKSFTDNALMILADKIHRLLSSFIGSNSLNLLINTNKILFNQISLNYFLIGVVGAHLQGQPLNYQLIQLDGRFVRCTKTTNQYKLYLLKNLIPIKPGLLYVKNTNQKLGIDIEIWSIPNENVGLFIQMISSPLSIGNIYLQDGQIVKGFLVESSAIDEQTEDITHFGGWKNYLLN